MHTIIDVTFTSLQHLQETVTHLKNIHRKKWGIIIHFPTEQTITRDIAVESTLSDTDIISFLSAHAVEFFGHTFSELRIDYETQNQPISNKKIMTVIAARDELIAQIELLLKKEKVMIHAISVNKKMNLLQWRKNLKKSRIKKIFFILFITTSMLFLSGIFLKLFLIKEIKAEEYQLKTTKEKIQKISLDHPNMHSALLKKLNGLYSKKLTSLKNNQMVESELSNIAVNMPNDISLTSLSITNKKIIISGIGKQLQTIHQYADSLKNIMVQKQVRLSELNESTQNLSDLNFTITVAS